jgi:hypothetical protein
MTEPLAEQPRPGPRSLGRDPLREEHPDEERLGRGSEKLIGIPDSGERGAHLGGARRLEFAPVADDLRTYRGAHSRGRPAL